MPLRPGLSLHVIERDPERLPFVVPLLARWMALDFEPRGCRAALEELLADPRSGATEARLDPAAVTRGEVVARPALLFPEAEWSLCLLGPRGTQRVRFAATAAPEVAVLVRRVVGREEDPGPLPPGWRATLLAGEEGGAASGAGHSGDGATAQGAGASGASPPPLPRIAAPGIYRREHGCAVIRSRTTTLMLDPVSHWMPHGPREPLALDGEVDALFITHGHADHWSVPSILAQAPSPATPVVVPPVPRPSLLAPNDLLGTLRLFGQNALAPAWGSRLRFGDIDVDVLPFYGEQPTRDGEPAPGGLRNWGSCYRFTTPDFSVLALIDSGVDPEGDMADVVRASAQSRGPVDVLMSSLPRFPSPFFFGLPHYYLALPFDRLRALHERHRRRALPSVTPGPDGILAICAAAEARHYLPYGNGYQGPGVPIGDVGMNIGEPPEEEIVRELAARAAAAGLPTRPLAWNPGDWVTLAGGMATKRVYAEA